jgi:hypothetical protein
VCFHVEVSARVPFLVQMSPTVFGGSDFVCGMSKTQEGGGLGPSGSVASQKEK